MNLNEKITSRREFFKLFPQSLINGFRDLTGDTESPGGPKVARLEISRCLAWSGSDCQLCYIACPLRDQAIHLMDQKPVINPAKCDGCGKCEEACSTINTSSAITLVIKQS